MAGFTNFTIKTKLHPNGHFANDVVEAIQKFHPEEVSVAYMSFNKVRTAVMTAYFQDVDSHDIEVLDCLILTPLSKASVPWRAAVDDRDDFSAEWWDSEGNRKAGKSI